MNALDDISTIKVKVARAQLGSAMDLFIRDKDAYSVQALACGGCEVIDGVAKLNNINRFALHIMRNYPDVDEKRDQAAAEPILERHQARDQPQRSHAELLELLKSFDDRANDVPLFKGWRDYHLVTGALPIAVQVFQVWWYATNEERLAPGVDVVAIDPFSQVSILLIGGTKSDGCVG